MGKEMIIQETDLNDLRECFTLVYEGETDFKALRKRFNKIEFTEQSSKKEAEIAELKENYNHYVDKCFKLEDTINELQSRIDELEKANDILTKELDNLNHLMPILDYHVDEFNRIKELCNPTKTK